MVPGHGHDMVDSAPDVVAATLGGLPRPDHTVVVVPADRRPREPGKRTSHNPGAERRATQARLRRAGCRPRRATRGGGTGPAPVSSTRISGRSGSASTAAASRAESATPPA